jgi:hypothetical protein
VSDEVEMRISHDVQKIHDVKKKLENAASIKTKPTRLLFPSKININ